MEQAKDLHQDHCGKKRLNASMIIFMVCILLTMVAWDHYYNSTFEIDRNLVSYLILISGLIFSIGASLIVSSLEMKRMLLEQEVATLQKFIPICAYCKKIRNDSGFWDKVEEYVGKYRNVRFSHGICPECLQSEKSKWAKT